ncbi:MAG TPA: 2OG-Fe dioxygenase family protein [Leptolyngbyaceae cyanobacterium]
MQTLLDSTKSAYGISFALEKVDSIKLEGFKRFFRELPVDPYIKGKYRSRRLSRFLVTDDRVTKLPHGYFLQSKEYNPLIGDVRREYAEIDDALVTLDEFQKLIWEFQQYCKLSAGVEIGVHQIRITCSPNNFGNPAPEGIHRDGCDYVGIFSIDRDNVDGAETHLYTAKKEKPIFKKVLHPGELLLVNDRDFLHFTTPVKPILPQIGTRDVFVLTYPSLLHG